MTNYLNMDIKSLHESLVKKEIKVIDLVNEAYEKIEKSNLNCFITLCKEQKN